MTHVEGKNQRQVKLLWELTLLSRALPSSDNFLCLYIARKGYLSCFDGKKVLNTSRNFKNWILILLFPHWECCYFCSWDWGSLTVGEKNHKDSYGTSFIFPYNLYKMTQNLKKSGILLNHRKLCRCLISSYIFFLFFSLMFAFCFEPQPYWLCMFHYLGLMHWWWHF